MRIYKNSSNITAVNECTSDYRGASNFKFKGL